LLYFFFISYELILYYFHLVTIFFFFNFTLVTIKPKKYVSYVDFSSLTINEVKVKSSSSFNQFFADVKLSYLTFNYRIFKKTTHYMCLFSRSKRLIIKKFSLSLRNLEKEKISSWETILVFLCCATFMLVLTLMFLCLYGLNLSVVTK
jgi:hypothetical protein